MVDVNDLEAYHFYKRDWETPEELREEFEWEIPETFNIADYICDRWASERNRVALFSERPNGETETFTFWQLQNATNRFANYLVDKGIEPGDRVAVNTPQRPETIISHIAILKIGAVTVPLSTRFGHDALRYRINDSDAKICIVDESNLESYRSCVKDCPNISESIIVGDVELEAGETEFWSAFEGYSREFQTAKTDPDDNAFILYTSGTTGDPKGVLHAHRLLLGNLPQFIATTCDMELADSDVFWIPAEWAWIGTLFTTVIPAMYYGKPVLAYDADHFDPQTAFKLIERYGVTVYFCPPTALRMMMKLENPDDLYDISDVRVVASGGEAVGQSIVDWTEQVFDDAVVHQAYGQTESHYVVGDYTKVTEYREGKMGRAEPGHEVAIVDTETAEQTVEPGETGEIALRYEGDPVYFKEYWNKPEKTAKSRRNGWHLTGDLGKIDEDGYFTFVGRKDDVIISSGYRIGPEEVEESLASHDAVTDAGVIGVEDEMKGNVPKAFVVLSDGYEPSMEMLEDLQAHVKDSLADYEYPREIEFINELPKTVTGKIRRQKLKEEYQ